MTFFLERFNFRPFNEAAVAQKTDFFHSLSALKLAKLPQGEQNSRVVIVCGKHSYLG